MTIQLLGEYSADVNKGRKVAFDCDGTLWDYDRKPRHEIIDLFRAFEALGCHMIIWSGGGIGYAEQAARNLGLKAQVVVKGSVQVDISFDDEGLGPNQTLVDMRV